MRTIIFSLLLLSGPAFSATDADQAPPPPSKVKYKSAKDLNFDKTVVEGQLKRPELNVVTGDNDPDNSGLLRLRESFADHATQDAGESYP